MRIRTSKDRISMETIQINTNVQRPRVVICILFIRFGERLVNRTRAGCYIGLYNNRNKMEFGGEITELASARVDGVKARRREIGQPDGE